MRTDEGGRRENAVSIVTGGEVDRGVLVEVGEEPAGTPKILSTNSDFLPPTLNPLVFSSFLSCGTVQPSSSSREAVRRVEKSARRGRGWGPLITDVLVIGQRNEWADRRRRDMINIETALKGIFNQQNKQANEKIRNTRNRITPITMMFVSTRGLISVFHYIILSPPSISPF